MRGSGLYSSEADFLIAVNRTQNNSRYSKLVFSRHDSDDDEIVTEFELSKYRLVEYKDSVSEGSLLKQEDGRTDDSNEKIILQEIEDIKKDKNINEVETNELSHLFDSNQAKMVKKTFYNAIDKLVFKGNIEKLKKGTYSIK